MTVVNQYRLYCNTEATYVYGYNTSTPTVCPNNNTHSIDTTTITIVQTISDSSVSVSNLPISPFNALITEEKTTLLELKSFLGKSLLRDIFTTVGTGTISNVAGTDSEYTLNVSGSTDVATLTSAERGRYIAGKAAEVGIGMRLPTALTGNQTLSWGYFDTTDGFYFKLTSSGLNAVWLRNSTETLIPRSSWNVDKVDGTGPSGVTLDLARGNIYHISFTWYGYGTIEFSVVIQNLSGVQTIILMHRMQAYGTTSTRQPNLPINVSLKNNSTVSTISAYISGRQFSTFGSYSPSTRINACYAYNVSINTTLFTPMLSIRRKTTHMGCSLKFYGVEVTSTVDTLIEVRVNTTLTGASFGNLQDQGASETAAELDTSATAVSGGTVIYLDVIFASGGGKTISTNTSYTNDLIFNIPENQILTVMAKSLSSAGNATCTYRILEEW